MGWMADDLLAALAMVPGSQEREHLMALLRRARRIRLDPAVVKAATATAQRATHSVERNLDRLDFAQDAMWIEYPHAPRLAEAEAAPAHAPETVGCLVACNPEDPAHVAVFVAWRFASGALHHSYALLHWNRCQLDSLAAASPSADDGHAHERLLDAATVAIPPGLMAELEVWQGYSAANHPWRGLAVEQTSRDAMGEHLFLLSALMLLASQAVSFAPCDDPEPPRPVVAANDVSVPAPANDTPPAPANDIPSVSAPTVPPRAVRRAAKARRRRGVAPLPEAPSVALEQSEEMGPLDVPESAPRLGELASLLPAGRRWPWRRGGFRSPAFGGPLAWMAP